MKKKITVTKLLSQKGVEPITCLTAYDYTSAKIIDNAGIEMILVGDSLGMVMQGNNSTVGVTVDELIYHSKMVVKAVERAFVMVDMPFGSYNTVTEGLTNACRIIKETNADAVKMEGATDTTQELVKRLTELGINVVCHIGLMPQHVGTMGGYKIQGYDNPEQLQREAVALEKAGAKLIVLEGIELSCSKLITDALSIPTIGIGAGVHCDGQVLVYHDVFGIYSDMTPKFVKSYANVGKIISEATLKYIEEVKGRVFPDIEHSFTKK